MIKINGFDLDEASVFPGGEVHIKLPNLGYSTQHIVIDAKIRSSDDLMQLVMIKDAIDRHYAGISVALHMFYFPYARQDRICSLREAFSLMAFIKLIDSLNFSHIVTFDLHSQVVRNNLKTPLQEVTMYDIFNKNSNNFINYILVAPDKGSATKVRDVASLLGLSYIVADKERTKKGVSYDKWVKSGGSLMDPTIISVGTRLLILDDICDGGATFTALAEVFNKPVDLYVTHGIFSKGLQPLFDSGIEKIYTTNTITTETPIEGKFEIWHV